MMMEVQALRTAVAFSRAVKQAFKQAPKHKTEIPKLTQVK